MQRHLGKMLFWTIIALVAVAFALALMGEDASSELEREFLLSWHEWLGLVSLLALLATIATRVLGTRRPSSLKWLPRLRGTVAIVLYALLALQPLSGWLLASHEGKLASFFGWVLPPLASPDTKLADYGYAYHGVGGILILLIAAFSLRLNVRAYAFNLLTPALKRRRSRSKTLRARSHAREVSEQPPPAADI